jgi:hypothetical protein
MVQQWITSFTVEITIREIFYNGHIPPFCCTLKMRRPMYTFFIFFNVLFVKEFTADKIVLENKSNLIILICGAVFYSMYFYGVIIADSFFLMWLFCLTAIFSSFLIVIGLMDLLVKTKVLLDREKVLINFTCFGTVIHQKTYQLENFTLEEVVEVKGEYLYSFLKLKNSLQKLPELAVFSELPHSVNFMQALNVKTEDYRRIMKLTDLISRIKLSFEELKSTRSNRHRGLVY